MFSSGGAVSTFNETEPDAVAPAKSVTVPETSKFVPLRVTCCGAGHCAIGATGPLQTKLTVGGVLFHPLLFGAGEAEATIVGRVVEIFTVTCAVSVLPAASVTVADTG